MKRTPQMDQAYFDEMVPRRLNDVNEFQSIASAPSTTPRHRRRLLHAAFQRSMEYLVACYSRGDAVESLREPFMVALNSLSLYQEDKQCIPHDFRYIAPYVHSLWLLSFAILLDVEAKHTEKLLVLLNNEGRDALFEELASFRASDRTVPATLLHADPYGHLLKVLQGSESERNNHILAFLEAYYGGMKNAYWYDTHKKSNVGFIGYWCFELAAVVKCLHVDDRAFTSNAYYPRDLVRRSDAS